MTASRTNKTPLASLRCEPPSQRRRGKNLLPSSFLRARQGWPRPFVKWRRRPYQPSETGWAVDRFANTVGYRMVELAHTGREADAEQGLRLLAQASRGFEETGVLEAIAAGLEQHGLSRLATIAHSLTWTRARSGGWLNFGGETSITSLHRASQLDPALALEVVGGEIERVVAGGTYGTDGVTRALVIAFTSGALTTPTSTSLDVAFDYWREACAVHCEQDPASPRLGRPQTIHTRPANSTGPTEAQDLHEAFALGVAANLSAAPREQKRRAFLAVQLLMSHRPATMAAALNFALSAVTDPATLMWLLRLIETDSSNRRDRHRSVQAATPAAFNRPASGGSRSRQAPRLSGRTCVATTGDGRPCASRRPRPASFGPPTAAKISSAPRPSMNSSSR